MTSRKRTLSQWAMIGCFPCSIGTGSYSAAAESFRDQIESDWQQQDERRMVQIRQPGLMRFVEQELQWPGVQPDDRLRVPKVQGIQLDGRPDDEAWTRAAKIPVKGIDSPIISLAYDDRSFYAAISLPTATEAAYRGNPTALDAGGAVDGVKDGKYAFHTGQEPNPWWQVDLGSSQPIGRIVVYNRLDYAPGLRNADNLQVLTSDDGHKWTVRHDNQGKHFGGITGAKPLVVHFDKTPLTARFVRLQISSDAPIFFHLDEVEIYSAEDPQKNLALKRPARQSSLSIWSRGGNGSGSLLIIGKQPLTLGNGDSPEVTLNGVTLSPQQARIERAKGQTRIELALPLADMPGGFPKEVTPPQGTPVRLAAGGDWQLTWMPDSKLGYGENRITIDLQGPAVLDPPVELTVQTVVFTPQTARQQMVFERRCNVAGSLPLTFQIADEGAAAVIVTAKQGEFNVRQGTCFFVAPVQETLSRTQRLLTEQELPAPPELLSLNAQAESLAAREQADGPAPDARAALYREARWLARKIAFADPRFNFRELLLVKRFTQETYPDVCLNHMPWCSRPGGDLCVVSLDSHDKRPNVRNLINGQLGPGHVHGADLHWDARRIVFGYAKARSNEPPEGWLDRRTSFDLRRNEEPTHLFEIAVDGKGLRQLTDGEWSDLDPTYLANGDIAFVSERCACSLQCNELDKDETSCNLYVMRADGSNIRQMSVSKDGDYLPHALSDGTIAYTRWEYQERLWANIQSIWTVRPDGTGADALFKQHMNDPWALEDIRSIPRGKKLLAIATGHHTLAAGPVVVIDPHRGLNSPAGIRIVTPGVLPPEGGMAGTPVSEGGVVGAGGHYMTPWPLSDTTFLASYTDGPQNDPTGYAIYLIDLFGTNELVYRDAAISCFLPMPLRPRPRPPIYPDTTDPAVDYATCTISNIGHGVPGIDPGRIRYLRISKRDQWPYDNTTGGQRYEPDVKAVMVNWTPARVIGTVPVETDGSVSFQVPADTPVYFQLLDENHMELRRMRSFISFQPGEVRGCVGCHETRAEAPVADRFPLALLREPRVPTPPPWGDRAISFLRDVQPVFDRHCTSCHSGLKPAGELDFSGGLTTNYSRCYDTIGASGLISRSNVGDDAQVTAPLAFGSHRSKLVTALRDELHAKEVRLDRNDWIRLVTWIDANGPYHGGFINKRIDPPPYNLPADRALLAKITAVHARRCQSCHEPSEVTRADWIDLSHPEQSRFLAAPLAKSAGGSGKCKRPVYEVSDDPDYRSVRTLVEQATAKAWARPRRDLRAVEKTQRLAGSTR